MGPEHLHIQAMCDVELVTPQKTYSGQGVLEQLIVGPHEPSGFKDVMDLRDTHSLEEVGQKVGEYLAGKWQKSVTTTQVDQVFGGASRETYILKLDVAGESQGVVVRRDPPTSLIDTERALEYGAYRLIHPKPKVHRCQNRCFWKKMKVFLGPLSR